MPKPRVFISSTYYNLKHIRSSLEAFVTQLGYEPILFENGDIPFHHDKPLDESCYDAINHVHIFVLIIGGSYGSSASGEIAKVGALKPDSPELEKMYTFYNSVTVEEYKKARQNDIPIYIFVEKGVASEFKTYKGNRDNSTIKYAHVDNVGIFKLLDSIFSETTNNLVREFENFNEISTWLKDQWAGLFADFLSQKKTDSLLMDLSSQVTSLNQVADALKSYSEAIVKKIEPDEKISGKLISDVEDDLATKLLLTSHLVRYVLRKNSKSSRNDISWASITAETANKLIKAALESANAADFLQNALDDKKPSRISEFESAERDFFNLKKKTISLK